MLMCILGFGLNDRHLKSNILSAKEKTLNNICPIASWTIYSQNYLSFKEKYNIDEMYAALLDKPNVYLVTGNTIFENGKTDLDIVVTYIKEHYLVDDINIEEVTNFNHKIYVYKLSR